MHRRLEFAARLLAEHRDVLEGRPSPGAGEPPLALRRRGWDSFLLSLGDDELTRIEVDGAMAPLPSRAPADLASMQERARDVCALPSLAIGAVPPGPLRPGETPRKRMQVQAFGEVVRTLAAGAGRVVDVGSGHGHLTRAIASIVSAPVVGLEREAPLAERARAMSAAAGPSFEVRDVLREGLSLAAGECAVGLHACGELGDVMATSVARTPGARMALVACCLQKRRQASRRPLCALDADLRAALDLPRALLGLSNLAATDDGVEATRAQNLAGRERRLALHRLLSEHVGPLRPGAEIDGLNRRAAQRSLTELVVRAFDLRSQRPPSPAAIAAASEWARVEHARSRRLSVPRALLSRVLEAFVAFDRAALLQQHGFDVRVGTLFPASVSPRNLVLIAS